MKTILFLNHTHSNCGVYQYGLRIYNIIKSTENINYIYIEIDSLEDYNNCILSYKGIINAIIYNYHQSTMSWLNNTSIQHTVKNIGIPHESTDSIFDIICNIDPDGLEDNNHFSLPRPIFENIDTILTDKSSSTEIDHFINEYQGTGLPIFGSFGFGFDNKGFDKIIRIVNESYDNAVIKLVIPVAHYDPNNMQTVINMKNKCLQQKTKEGIKIMITHTFFSNDDILRFLASNTMNIFLYDKMYGRGVSSTIDYALSVKKPIGISDSYMFRNIYNDNICLYKISIDECLQRSTSHCSQFLEKYSHKNIINKFKDAILNIQFKARL